MTLQQTSKPSAHQTTSYLPKRRVPQAMKAAEQVRQEAPPEQDKKARAQLPADQDNNKAPQQPQAALSHPAVPAPMA